MVTVPDADTVGVVGIGEVGLRLSRAFADVGFDVVAVDIDEERIEQLHSGTSYIRDVSDEAVADLFAGSAVATTDYDALDDVDFVAVCVPTPLQKSKQPDVSYVVTALQDLAEIVPTGCTIVIESTVYPGATESAFADILADAGRTVGEDVHLAFSPERVDPGNTEYEATAIPKVVGGVTPTCGDLAEALYDQVFDEVIRLDSSTEAEMAKILENTFRNVNIALVNELARVADDLGIDIWNVIEAAESKPFGFMSFYPGPGLGGHCIPVDPLYLSWRAKQEGLEAPLIDQADKINREMSEYIIQRVTRLLNDDGIALANAQILVLGVTYKPDIPDTRNSPELDIIKHLQNRNATVQYHDPYVSEITVDDTRYESRDLTNEVLGKQDCTLIVTDHSCFDVGQIVEVSDRVFDSRNATRGYDGDGVVRL